MTLSSSLLLHLLFLFLLVLLNALVDDIGAVTTRLVNVASNSIEETFAWSLGKFHLSVFPVWKEQRDVEV